MTVENAARKTFRTNSFSDKVFYGAVYLILILMFAIVAYPLIYVISASLSDPAYVISGRPIFFPVGLNFDGYAALFEDKTIVSGFKNSLIYTVCGTIINLFLTISCAYALSRKDLKGRNVIAFILLFTIIFDAGIMPNYLVVRNVGIIFTRWAMILPTAMGAWYVFIVRTFFQNNIPDDLLEAAKLDGCNDFQFLVRIVIPLSGAIIAVIALFVAVDHWGMFFYALLYLNKADMHPIQLVLREILMQSNISLDMLGGLDGHDAAKLQLRAYSIKYSLIVVASIPLMVAYPFVQKYFVKGVMVGSIKG